MEEYRCAALYQRVCSFLIDVCILYLSSSIFIRILNMDYSASMLMLIAGFFSIPYFIFFWKYSGRTLGGYLLKIKVVSDHSNGMSIKELFLRAGALFVFVAPVGIIIVLAILNGAHTVFWSLQKSPYKEKKQAVWDIAAHTCVVESK